MAADKIKEFFKSFESADEKISFRMAHENIGHVIPAISTGSPLLDDALSCGGLPKGRIIQYYGPTGSGKTLLSMLAIKSAQADDPESIQMFIDVEQTFDPSWAQKLGCDPSRILLVDGDTAVYARECFTMLLGVPKADAKTHEYVGQQKPGFLDEIASGNINCNLIIYDSVGAAIPPGEDTSAIGKMNMSLLARFLTTTFRKLSLSVARANIPFICINHKRDNMEKYGMDHTFSGGNTYAHSLSANVYFERINRKDSAVLDDNEEVIGTLIRGSVEKSKFGSWPRKCEFTVDFNTGIINLHEEIGQLAIKYDVVKKPSTMSYEYKDQKWVGANKFFAAIAESPEFAEELKKEIVEARNGNVSKLKEEQEQRTVQVAEKAVRGRPKKTAIQE